MGKSSFTTNIHLINHIGLIIKLHGNGWCNSVFHFESKKIKTNVNFERKVLKSFNLLDIIKNETNNSNVKNLIEKIEKLDAKEKLKSSIKNYYKGDYYFYNSNHIKIFKLLNENEIMIKNISTKEYYKIKISELNSLKPVIKSFDIVLSTNESVKYTNCFINDYKINDFF